MGNGNSTRVQRDAINRVAGDAKQPDDSPHMRAAQASFLQDGVVFRRRGSMLRAEYKDYAMCVAAMLS